MQINWLVRIKNPTFWTALIPAILILIQTVAAALGYTLDLTETGNKLLAIVEAVFGLLAILGIAIDPTTAGVGDSKRALSYTEPYEDSAA